MSVQSMREVGKDFCPNFIQPFLENIHRRIRSDESWEFIALFHSPNLKSRSSPPALAFTLAYLEEVYSENVSSGSQKLNLVVEVLTL